MVRGCLPACLKEEESGLTVGTLPVPCSDLDAVMDASCELSVSPLSHDSIILPLVVVGRLDGEVSGGLVRHFVSVSSFNSKEAMYQGLRAVWLVTQESQPRINRLIWRDGSRIFYSLLYCSLHEKYSCAFLAIL